MRVKILRQAVRPCDGATLLELSVRRTILGAEERRWVEVE